MASLLEIRRFGFCRSVAAVFGCLGGVATRSAAELRMARAGKKRREEVVYGSSRMARGSLPLLRLVNRSDARLQLHVVGKLCGQRIGV
jgi:hypothetical protein